MIFAIPILIAVVFFLCWCLVKLTVHALPLFAGAMAFSLLSHVGISVVAAVIGGALIAIAVVAGGRLLMAQTRSSTLRLAVLTAFAAPASFAAYRAVMGLAALVIGSDAWRTMGAVTVACLVGSAAWRKVAAAGMREQAG